MEIVPTFQLAVDACILVVTLGELWVLVALHNSVEDIEEDVDEYVDERT